MGYRTRVVEVDPMDRPAETALDRLRNEVSAGPDPSDAAYRAAQLRLGLQMADAGIRMMRLSLRRKHPGEPDDAIEARLAAWLQDRPGAEFGDAWGRPAPERFASP